MEREKFILAFCRLGPAGLAPKAPGTVGTLAALVMAPCLFLPLSLPLRILLLAVLFAAGAAAATEAEKILGKKDPGEVVIDELVGVWIAILPFGFSWTLLVLAFVLFRIFDILKPWPIHASESWLPAGGGIMIDDVVGGIISMLCLLVLRWTGLFAFPWL